MSKEKTEDKAYACKIILGNRNELRKHLEQLNEKYGRGNVPIEEAVKFNFKWGFVPTN